MTRDTSTATLTNGRELMQLHVETLFTHDAAGDLVRVNEPSGAPAPRFFFGSTVDGSVLRFRYDVDLELRRELERAAEAEVRQSRGVDSPADAARYEEILARAAPARSTWAGPAFSFPGELPAVTGPVLVTEANAELLRLHLQAWVPDVPLGQPMVALPVDGRAVAICGSVRRSGRAHEAGVETASPYRGRGYAAQVVAAWARAVRDTGRIPLYSTSWRNEASRAVARKLALIQFGSDLHIT